MKPQTYLEGHTTVTLIEGDGIGPEVIQSAKQIIEAADAQITWESAVAGKKIFESGNQSGVPDETIDSIKKNMVVFKGPLETPIGYGQKSANVTLRKLFETYANIRPVRELPSVKTPFSGKNIDLVVVRENVEDLYAGIEYMQTPGVAECLKIISRKGCEKIVRMAFEFAISEGRDKVHCATKANIMKLTEGLLKRTFEEIALEYPNIESHHIIIDNCAHQLVRYPESFDVIVTTNMNGDILSDLTSGLIGGLGFAPSANIGAHASIFEAVHGSAPDIAGQNIANPTAAILAGVMMLRHIGETKPADQIQQSLLYTLENGIYTIDVSKQGHVSTQVFTEHIIKNLGKTPSIWKSRQSKQIIMPETFDHKAKTFDSVKRECYGVDVFIETQADPNKLGQHLENICEGTPFKLKIISNRGTKVYPEMDAYTDCADYWSCRFLLKNTTQPLQQDTFNLLINDIAKNYTWMHIEKLWHFDDNRAYSLAQGED